LEKILEKFSENNRRNIKNKFSASGFVLFIGGIGWLCCTRRQQQDETFSNGVVLQKHENSLQRATLTKTDSESDYQEKRILDPATEDPVARRAIRILQFKACPDTRLVS